MRLAGEVQITSFLKTPQMTHLELDLAGLRSQDFSWALGKSSNRHEAEHTFLSKSLQDLLINKAFGSSAKISKSM